MANQKKEGEFLNTDDVIIIVAKREGFTKSDAKALLDELKNVFEECIVKGVDIDLKGFIHLSIITMNYTKPPGIVGYHGGKDFNKKGKKIIYSVPLNFKQLLKEEDKKNIDKT